jgi:hypothetical protein
MADRIRFHLNEHVDPAIAAALHRAGIDVTTTIQAGLRTQNDEAHLRFARAEGRVIVTRDQDFDVPPEVFAEIIFGHWMPQDKRAEILAIVQDKYPQIELYEAKLNETDFNLDILRYR